MASGFHIADVLKAFTVAHFSLLNQRPLIQAALSSFISGFVFSA